jgi:hypothetical protein
VRIQQECIHLKDNKEPSSGTVSIGIFICDLDLDLFLLKNVKLDKGLFALSWGFEPRASRATRAQPMGFNFLYPH